MFCKGTVEISVVPSTLQGRYGKHILQTCLFLLYSGQPDKDTDPSAGKFSFSRDWLTNGNNLVVSGNVASIRKDNINIYDSPAFFMHTFLERLRAKGVVVPQSYAFAELPRDSVHVERMAGWDTSVQKVLNQLMKESDNLNAEALLCRLGAQATGKRQVAAEDGIVEIMKLIRRLGLTRRDYKIADGCGLSNYNYLSPALLVDFLKYAYSRTGIFRKLYKSLPVGGVDGTLKNRMKSMPTFPECTCQDRLVHCDKCACGLSANEKRA